MEDNANLRYKIQAVVLGFHYWDFGSGLFRLPARSSEYPFRYKLGIGSSLVGFPNLKWFEQTFDSFVTLKSFLMFEVVLVYLPYEHSPPARRPQSLGDISQP